MSSPGAPASTLARLGLPNGHSVLAVAIVTSFVVAAASSIDAASRILDVARLWVVTHFDWLFVLVANTAIASVALFAVVPRANVRLGSDDSRPEFGALAWFAMLFSAGLASGLLYWSTAEPILHQRANPFLATHDAGSTAVAAQTALRLTILHWGLHGWAFYVLAALSIAIYAYRHGQPLAFRTALYPVLGARRLDRWPGKAIDLLALFGTVCGVATSIGLSAGSMNATLQSLFAIDVDTVHQVAIVFGVCGLGIASAISGLSRGIRLLSELNVWISALLLLAILLLGPTLYLGDLVARTLLDYLLYAIPTGLWLATTPQERAWQGAWTIFYWAWWLAWMPFVSLFIARISKGRTVRELVSAVMLAPTLVTLVWMCIWGGTAIAQERSFPGTIAAVVDADYSLGLSAVLEGLGSPVVVLLLTGTAALLLFTWLVTSIDSATLVICQLLASEETRAAKLFWGGALAAVAALLLVAGGLGALQAASIIVGLPLAVLMLPLAAGLLRDLLRNRL